MTFDDPAWHSRTLYTSIRVFKSLLRRSVAPLRKTVVSFDGGRSRIVADLGTALGLQLYRYGKPDPDRDLVRHLLRPGETFVDGGANIGLFTLTAAASVGSTGSVVAFEPADESRRRLAHNIALNGFDWVSVRSEGLDRESTNRSFVTFEGDAAALSSFAPEGARARGTVNNIATCTLDDALGQEGRRRVSLVKLDLEGAEYSALLGARALLADGSADLLIELEPEHLARQGASAMEVVSLLRGFGFDFYRVEGDGQGQVRLVREPRPEIRGRTPNFLATKTAERARRAGIPVQGP